MYDRVSAVLAELIANAYDADAENVTVKLPFDKYLARRSHGEIIDQGYEIVIEDDGFRHDGTRGFGLLPERGI